MACAVIALFDEYMGSVVGCVRTSDDYRRNSRRDCSFCQSLHPIPQGTFLFCNKA